MRTPLSTALMLLEHADESTGSLKAESLQQAIQHIAYEYIMTHVNELGTVSIDEAKGYLIDTITNVNTSVE